MEKLESTLTAVESDVFGKHGPHRRNPAGATEAFGSYFLAPHLAHFCTQHPSITVDLLPMPRSEPVKREADASVTIDRPTTDSFGDQQAHPVPPAALRHGRLSAPTGPIRDVSDLASLRWIDYVDDLLFTDQQVSLPQVAALGAVVLAQHQRHRPVPGRALGPGHCRCFPALASREPGLVPVLPDVVDVTRDFWLVAPAERRELARIKALWDYLRRVTELNQDFLMGQSAENPVWVP